MSRTNKCEGVLSKVQAKFQFFLFQALQTINCMKISFTQTLLFVRLLMVIRYVNIIAREDMLDRIISVLTKMPLVSKPLFPQCWI